KLLTANDQPDASKKSPHTEKPHAKRSQRGSRLSRGFLQSAAGLHQKCGRARVLRRPLRGFVRIGMGSTTAGFHVGPFRESRLGRIQAYVTAVTPPLVVLETRS